MTGGLRARFLSGPDIDSLGLSGPEIAAAVEDAVRAHGDARAVVEPRVHLVPVSIMDATLITACRTAGTMLRYRWR